MGRGGGGGGGGRLLLSHPTPLPPPDSTHSSHPASPPPPLPLPGNYTEYVRQKGEREAQLWSAWERQTKEIARQAELVARLSAGARSGRASTAGACVGGGAWAVGGSCVFKPRARGGDSLRPSPHASSFTPHSPALVLTPPPSLPHPPPPLTPPCCLAACPACREGPGEAQVRGDCDRKALCAQEASLHLPPSGAHGPDRGWGGVRVGWGGGGG